MKISQALGATLLTAALVAGPICAATASPGAPSPAPAVVPASPAALSLFKTANRQKIIETFDGINAFRKSKGLKPLKFNVTIATISQKWSDRMAETGEFVHNGDFVSGAPRGWSSASENIAWSSDGGISGQGFVNLWINSPGHNANMSRPGDSYMGIGISSLNGRTYATANHFEFAYFNDGTLPGTYNSPRDFFNGLPALPTSHSNSVTASDPMINLAEGTYTIPATTGVIYLVDGAVKAAGTYAARSTVLAVTTKAAAGYTLTTTPTWYFDLSSLAVTATAPTFNRTKGTYTIPAKNGISYLVDGAVKAAGTYPSSSIVTITAKATAPYFVTGTNTWSYDFRRAVTAVKPAMNSSTNRYTIPKQSGVAYFVDGKPVPAGTYKVANGKTLKFTAKNSSPTYRLTGTAAWSYRF